MPDIEAPEYRLRIFLSVDLTGSTDFKSKNKSTAWLKAFQKFYGGFPKTFMAAYEDVCSTIPQLHESERICTPKVWKTIGDEILFVNRVHSLCHVSAYVTSFIEALKQFGQELHNSSDQKLNTKGNAWIAAFPSPNCSIRLSMDGDVDPINGSGELPSEDSEKEVDQDPKSFDFLGKGIDGGFRISRNSTVNTLTVSPGLAFLLCKARRSVDTTQFKTAIHFDEMQTFKGVANGEPYPIITLDTTRDEKRKQLLLSQRKVLRSSNDVICDDLHEYLDGYLDFHNIEKPVIKVQFNANDEKLPAHYDEYLSDWNSIKQALDQTQIIETVSGDEDGTVEADTDDKGAADEIVSSIDVAVLDKR